MTSPKNCILAAVAGVLSVGTFSAFADNTTTDLSAEVATLRGEVATLRAKQAQDSKAVAATIDQVLRDAEKRSQMMAGMSGAGYDDKGFWIGTGDFLFRPGILFQFWSVTDYRSDTSGPKDDEIESGFEIHRVEFSIAGTAFTPALSYNIMWDVGGDGSSLTLFDAYITYMFKDDWGFRAGQWSSNFLHEDYLGNNTILAVERSMLDNILGAYPLRYQGVSLLYGNWNDKNPISAELTLHDGSASINSNYVGHYPSGPGTSGGPSFNGNHDFDFGVGGRFEWKNKDSSWSNYGDFTAKGTMKDLLVIGAAFNWDQGGDVDVLGATVDIQYENKNGLGLYAAVVVRHTDGSDGSTTFSDGEGTDWGFLLQASYMLNKSWEIFGRYSYIQFDEDVVAEEDTFHEITVGVNYYLGKDGSAGHRAKVTIDLNWLPSGAAVPQTNIGYLGDNGDETEVSLRGQFQLNL